MNLEPVSAEREAHGREIEGWAFTFCKAAFLALLLSKYTLLVTATVAVSLYVVAAAYGVRDWRCFLKPPWVVIFLALVAAAQTYFLFFHAPSLIL